jgi:hypothetical protein
LLIRHMVADSALGTNPPRSVRLPVELSERANSVGAGCGWPQLCSRCDVRRQDATAAACRLPVCPATVKERVSGDVADFGVSVGHAGMPFSGYRDLDDPTARGRGRPEGDTALRLAPKSLCSWGSQNPEGRA